MPYSLHWEAPDGVLRRYIGRVTAAERKESLERIFADARFDRLRYAITDYLAVTDYEVQDESTEEIAALHVGPLLTNPGILIAAVATQRPVLNAIAHFKSLGFIGDHPYRVFATQELARAVAHVLAAASKLGPPQTHAPPRPAGGRGAPYRCVEGPAGPTPAAPRCMVSAKHGPEGPFQALAARARRLQHVVRRRQCRRPSDRTAPLPKAGVLIPPQQALPGWRLPPAGR